VRDRLIGAALLLIDHVEVVVGLSTIPQELREELQAVDVIDGVAEILDAAGKVEHHDQRGIDLIRSVSAQPCPLGGERVDQLAELRCQPLPLPLRRGL